MILKNILHITAKAIILMVCLTSSICAFADGPVTLIPDNGGGEKVDKPGDNRHRAPGRHITIQAIYTDGELSCPEWAESNDAVNIIVTDHTGTAVFEASYPGVEFADGILIGHYDSFTLTITTAGGVTYRGSYSE